MILRFRPLWMVLFMVSLFVLALAVLTASTWLYSSAALVTITGGMYARPALFQHLAHWVWH